MGNGDCAESQASLIVQSLDGYLLRNPGSSRISEADLLTGDRSDPRNPVLVRMFRLIGLAAEASTVGALVAEPVESGIQSVSASDACQARSAIVV
jgi:hypothetical protein